jgi:acetyl-CoA carboxylase biotin carboxyl carrier protein
MALTEKEVFEILSLFEKSDWQDLHLESATFKLTVSKRGRPAEAPARPAAAPARSPSAAPATSPRPVVAKPAAAPAPRPAPASPAAAEPADPRWVAVTAPTLGTFYVAPKPGAPPFVTVGQKVAADDTVAIVEVMKLMNHVSAGTAGTIVRIAATNGEMVEYDEVLFWIDPE